MTANQKTVLQQPAFNHRGSAVHTDHNVVQEADVDELECVSEMAGQGDVGGAGCGIA